MSGLRRDVSERGDEKDDDDDDDDCFAAPPPKVSKGGSTRNGGAKARREIVKGCIAEMMNKGSGVAARRHTLEGLRDNFLGQVDIPT
jgi:hypothetical protein